MKHMRKKMTYLVALLLMFLCGACSNKETGSETSMDENVISEGGDLPDKEVQSDCEDQIVKESQTDAVNSTGSIESATINIQMADDLSIDSSDMDDYDYPDKIYFDYADKQDIFVLRAGDSYFFSYVGKSGWVRPYGAGVPDDLILNDGEFCQVNADLMLVSGGIKGYYKSPSIKRINSQKAVTQSDVEKAGSLADYNSIDSGFPFVFTYSEGSDNYLVTYENGNKYRIYKNGVYFDTYNTQYEAEAALGIRDKADENALMERAGNYSVYVFRCGDKYLVYIGSILFGDNGNWIEYLNEDFENQPKDFTLKDGEAILLKNASLYKVNGGEENYINAPMIMSYDSSESIILSTLTLNVTMEHWEENPEISDYQTVQYGGGDTMIVYLDGKYHLYKMDYEDFETKLIGVYDTVEEVNDSIENNCK